MNTVTDKVVHDMPVAHRAIQRAIITLTHAWAELERGYTPLALALIGQAAQDLDAAKFGVELGVHDHA